MKIGILTYHRGHNYGALLQAVALRQILQGLGNQVTYIDYYPRYHQALYKLFSFYSLCHIKGWKNQILYIYKCIRYYAPRKKRYENFETFIDNEIKPFCGSLNECYDIIIYGSDQIWRKQPFTNEYNPVYFGQNNITTKRNISYAASMGNMSLSLEDKVQLKTMLSHLDKISVREKELKVLVESLGFLDVEQVSDPTLLLDSKDWDKLISTQSTLGKRYVLFYDLLNKSFDYSEIKKFASQKKLELVVISGNVKHAPSENNRTIDGPYQFLDLIRNADYVITSSFHGLVFSIIYKKPFFASFAKNADRAKSLLETVGLIDRLVAPRSELPMDVPSINYQYVDEKLSELRNSSISFLSNNLNIYGE